MMYNRNDYVILTEDVYVKEVEECQDYAAKKFIKLLSFHIPKGSICKVFYPSARDQYAITVVRFPKMEFDYPMEWVAGYFANENQIKLLDEKYYNMIAIMDGLSIQDIDDIVE